MKRILLLFISLTVRSITFGQTANTLPLPAGETIVGGHLHIGASNEIWTDATSLYFNYRGNNTATYFWNKSTNLPLLSMLNSGYVGIGLTNPSAQFDISGHLGSTDSRNFRVKYFLDNNAAVGGAELSGIAHVNGYWTALYANQGNATSAAFFNGRVGFGTPSPSANLDILTNAGYEIKFSGLENGNIFAEKSLYFLSNVDISFGSNGVNNQLTLNNGNLGVGIAIPIAQLDVSGKMGGAGSKNFRVKYFDDNNPSIGGAELSGIAHVNGYWTAVYAKQGNASSAAYFDGSVGIGVDQPSAQLDILGHMGGTGSRNFRIKYFQDDNVYIGGAELSGIAHVNGYWTALYAKQGNASSAAFFDGNVGIGTTSPAYKLDVLGTIRAQEILVNLNGVADYVFESSYKIMPLNEVERFVKTNKHLPEIPSAKEVEKNGVNMGEMQNKLLQKIEELTLYMIEMKKENEELKNRVSELEKK